MQEKEYKMCLEAYNEKSNEKATLVNRLMEVDSAARYLCNLHAIAFVLRTLCISIILLGVTRIIRLGPLKQRRFVFFSLAARKREREAADEETRRAQQDDRVPLLDLLSREKKKMMVR